MTYSYQYIHNHPNNPFINIYYQDKYVHILSNDITADNVLQVYHILISLGNNEIRLQVKLAELYEIAKSEGYEKINFDRTSYHDLDRIALTKDKCAGFSTWMYLSN